MNDLEYRRKQLLKLQESVIDLEDLSTGISITDLTLSDFRMDLAHYLKEHPETLEHLPLGAFAITTTADEDIPPGIVFCLEVVGPAAERVFEPNYPLAPTPWFMSPWRVPFAGLTHKPSKCWMPSSEPVLAKVYLTLRPLPTGTTRPNKAPTCARCNSYWPRLLPQ